MNDQYSKLPRIYLNQDLEPESNLSLDEGPAHYFRSVLRRQDGDRFRVFNGRDGEWLAQLTKLGKRSALAKALECITEQPPQPPARHLIFAPIKKQRLNFLIEKAVELGVTDLHPVLTTRTTNRKINHERIEAQIIEAAEQCERMHVPRLHNLDNMKTVIKRWSGPKPVKACIERHEAKNIKGMKENKHAFLIGPEGGFDDDEVEFLSAEPNIDAISLGETVYRAETACILCLAQANNFS